MYYLEYYVVIFTLYDDPVLLKGKLPTSYLTKTLKFHFSVCDISALPVGGSAPSPGSAGHPMA